jgi:hypothetical protein
MAKKQHQHEEQRHAEHDSGWLMLEMDVAEYTKKSAPLRNPYRLA